MRRVVTAIALLALTATVDAAVYQCTRPDGGTVFSDSPCGADARELELEGNQHFGGRADNAAMLQRYNERRERRRERAQTAAHGESERRQVPGVAECPAEKAIEAAVDDERVIRCMARSEVREAQPLKGSDPDERQRLLETGISVTEWYYARHEAQWPTIVWFRAGYVTGFE